jgi:uncharacterized protein (TIGR03435 family)
MSFLTVRSRARRPLAGFARPSIQDDGSTISPRGIALMMRTFASLAIIACLSGVVVAQAPPPPPAQSQATAHPAAETQSAAPTHFEAADVHFTPWSRSVFYSGAFLSNGRLFIHQATLMLLIATAFNLDQTRFIGGGPSWVAFPRYDIEAKVPPGTTMDTARLMLQNLLADRFKLVVHKGDVQVPAYVLTVAAGKPNLKPSTAVEEGTCKPHYPPPPGSGSIPSMGLECQAVSMQSLANWLEQVESRDYLPYGTPVIDATGLKGLYDINLKWTPKFFLPTAGPSGVSIFQALAQAGLDFEFKTTPRPGLVIDSAIETPTPNAPDLAKIMPPLPPRQFEVATIRPSQPGETGQGRIAGDELNFQGISLKTLIAFAWDIDPRNDGRLVAPKWIESDRIDIHARVAATDLGNSSMRGRSNSMNFDDFRPMLRALLIDRFQIRYHMENRSIDAYTLVADHPKLTNADPSERTACGEGPAPNVKDASLTNVMINSQESCWNVTMDEFAAQLHHIAPDYFFYPVVNATGIKGSWDLSMSWSSANLTQNQGTGLNQASNSDAAPAAADPNGAVSFFDAIRKELGLKVIKEKETEPVLVIDSIDEQPTEN